MLILFLPSHRPIGIKRAEHRGIMHTNVPRSELAPVGRDGGAGKVTSIRKTSPISCSRCIDIA